MGKNKHKEIIGNPVVDMTEEVVAIEEETEEAIEETVEEEIVAIEEEVVAIEEEVKRPIERNVDNIEITPKKIRKVLLATPSYYVIEKNGVNITIEGMNDKRRGDTVLY